MLVIFAPSVAPGRLQGLQHASEPVSLDQDTWTPVDDPVTHPILFNILDNSGVLGAWLKPECRDR